MTYEVTSDKMQLKLMKRNVHSRLRDHSELAILALSSDMKMYNMSVSFIG